MHVSYYLPDFFLQKEWRNNKSICSFSFVFLIILLTWVIHKRRKHRCKKFKRSANTSKKRKKLGSLSLVSLVPRHSLPLENGQGGRPWVIWDHAFFFLFFASLLLWLEREKYNAWYIYLTSRQPPPNLHNLTSAWPVMLLANKRLPYGNQILARIMSLLKSILGKRKFLSTSMFRWRFLKKNFNVLFLRWNTASWSCRTFI